MTMSCSEDDSGDLTDNFDRASMLANWADNIIIPGYQTYVNEVGELKTATSNFTSSPSNENLSVARAAWLNANLAWQAVAMFEIGKAEELTLINFTNIYPTDTEQLVQSIESESYDLATVSSQDEQGFPAIEYLLYGVRTTDQEIVSLYSEGEASQAYATYLTDLVLRLETLGQSVLEDWQNGYRDSFISNDGSEATSSVNKLVNDYIFYYEKHLRAGKIGIPAGIFSGAELPEKVEGLYSDQSKVLFDAGLDAMVDFFNGVSSQGTGESLSAYLTFLNTIKDGEDLSEIINLQFVSAESASNQLSDNFSADVTNDNSRMLGTYDELQKNVVNLKVDMLQALNIRVDFVDADGD